MTVYEKIDKVLTPHEKYKYAERSLDSLAEYISWAWKWHKITEDEKNKACDRICALFERELIMMKAKE